MKESCVYYTWYKGNKMPPNYIGSCYTENIELHDYHGSVSSKKWKQTWEDEIKTHPELFKTEILIRFSNRQDATNMEELIQRELNVIKSDEYINESFANKGFTSKGYKWTEDQRLQNSGVNHWNYGKHLSDEVKKKIGDRDYSMNSDISMNKKKSKTMKQTIKDRGCHWSKGVECFRKGMTNVELYGADRAKEISELSSVKAKNRETGICVFCGIQMDISNLVKYHNDNCIYHKDIQKRAENEKRCLLQCPHCNKEGKISGMKQWHFDKCKFKDDKFWEEW